MTYQILSKYNYYKVFILVNVIIYYLYVPCTISDSNIKQTLEEPSTPIQVNISIDKIPNVNESAILQFEIVSIYYAEDTTVQIDLPPDAVVTNGDITWKGNLLANQAHKMSLEILFETEGKKKITCSATKIIDESNSWGDLESLFLTVGSQFSQLGYPSMLQDNSEFLGVADEIGEGEIIDSKVSYPASIKNSQNSLEITIEPNNSFINQKKISNEKIMRSDDGSLTIEGRWRFYGRNNSIESERMKVYIARGDNYRILSNCYTDENGYYSCGPFSNPGSVGVRSVFVTSVTFSQNQDTLRVINPDTEREYAYTTPVKKFQDGTYNIGSYHVGKGKLGEEYDRAFWLQKDLIKVWSFIYENVGKFQNPKVSAGSCTIRWKVDGNKDEDGNFYRRGGDIYLKADAPLSNSVVGHEYGHRIMYGVYGNWMPITNCPKRHYCNRSSNEICAWSEGWATFLALAVNDSPVYRWSSGSETNYENTKTTNWDNGETVEGRVSASLWDIYDTHNDNLDTYSDQTFQKIWDVLYSQNDNTFKEYWTARKERGHNVDDAINCLLENTIDYRDNGNDDDFGNTCYESHQLLNNQALTGNIDEGDSDYFKFTLSKSSYVELKTIGTTDTYGILFSCCDGSPPSTSCEVIRVDDINGANRNFSINEYLSSGTYYLKIRHYNRDTGSGKYILKFSSSN
jgi:hypothetical protein